MARTGHRARAAQYSNCRNNFPGTSASLPQEIVSEVGSIRTIKNGNRSIDCTFLIQSVKVIFGHLVGCVWLR